MYFPYFYCCFVSLLFSTFYRKMVAIKTLSALGQRGSDSLCWEGIGK